jgi:hypothetical protein
LRKQSSPLEQREDGVERIKNPASNSMDTGLSFLASKVAGVNLPG